MSGTASGQTFQVNITARTDAAAMQLFGRAVAGVQAELRAMDRAAGPLARVTGVLGASVARANMALAPMAGRLRGLAGGFVGATAAAAGLAGIFGAGALVGFARDAATASAEVEQLRQSLRGSEEMRRLSDGAQLLDTHLQALAFSARANGMSVDDLSSPLQRMGSLLQQLSGRDGAAARRMLGNLGVGFQDAQHNLLSMTDLLASVAVRLEQLPDTAHRQRLMTQIFGPELGANQALLRMLLRLRQDNARFLASGGPVSVDERKRLADYQRAMNSLSDAAGRLQSALGAALAPVLTELAGILTGLVNDNRDLIATNVSAWVRQFAAGLREFPWQEVREGISWIVDKLRWMVDNVGGAGNAIKIMGVALAAAFAAPIVGGAVSLAASMAAMAAAAVRLGGAGLGAAFSGLAGLAGGGAAAGAAAAAAPAAAAAAGGYGPVASAVGMVPPAAAAAAPAVAPLTPGAAALALAPFAAGAAMAAFGAYAVAQDITPRSEDTRRRQRLNFRDRARLGGVYGPDDLERDPRVPGLPRLPMLPTRESIDGHVEVTIRLDGAQPGTTATARTTGEGMAPPRLNIGPNLGGGGPQ